MEVLIRIVGGRPEDGSQVLRVGSVPRLGLLVQLIDGVPGPWESTHLVVPGRTLLQRLRIHLGEVVGPIRDVYGARSSDPAARKNTDSPTRLLIIQRRTASCTSGPGPPGWRTACQGPRHLSSSRQSPNLGGWWAACQGPRHLGAPHQRLFGMGIPVRSGRSARRAAGKGFLPSEMTALASR